MHRVPRHERVESRVGAALDEVLSRHQVQAVRYILATAIATMIAMAAVIVAVVAVAGYGKSP